MMWYFHENGDISQIKSNIKLTDLEAKDAINAKINGKIVNYKNEQLIFTDPVLNNKLDKLPEISN